MQFLFRQAWFGRFGFVVLVLVGLVVCFGRFGTVVFIWQVFLGRFGSVGLVWFRNFLFGRLVLPSSAST